MVLVGCIADHGGGGRVRMFVGRWVSIQKDQTSRGSHSCCGVVAAKGVRYDAIAARKGERRITRSGGLVLIGCGPRFRWWAS